MLTPNSTTEGLSKEDHEDVMLEASYDVMALGGVLVGCSGANHSVVGVGEHFRWRSLSGTLNTARDREAQSLCSMYKMLMLFTCLRPESTVLENLTIFIHPRRFHGPVPKHPSKSETWSSPPKSPTHLHKVIHSMPVGHLRFTRQAFSHHSYLRDR